MHKRYLVSVLALGLLLGLASAGHPFSAPGPHWNTTFVYYEDNLPNSWEWAAYYAKNTWNGVTNANGTQTNFDFYRSGHTDRTKSKDSHNVVCRRDMGKNGTLALCWTWWDAATNHLSEFDIEINTAYTWATDQPWWYWWWYDVQNVVTHEFGHALQLDDLYGNGDKEKTMYGYSGQTETKKRSLDNDDKAGMRSLYP
jgi:hypothetical protein